MVRLLLSVLLLLAGCQQNRKEDPYADRRPHLIGQQPSALNRYAEEIVQNATQPKTVDAKIRKMELKAQQEIERLKAQKELELAKIRAEAEKSKVMTEKELTLKKIQARLEEIVGDRRLTGWVVALSALFLFLLLWAVVKLTREYFVYRKRLEEERMRHEKELQEKELQTRLAEKMFEALGSGQLNDEQKNRLLESLGGSNHLLEHKGEKR